MWGHVLHMPLKRPFKLGPRLCSAGRVAKVSEQGPARTEFELESVAIGRFFSRWHFAYFIRREIKAPAAWRDARAHKSRFERCNSPYRVWLAGWRIACSRSRYKFSSCLFFTRSVSREIAERASESGRGGAWVCGPVPHRHVTPWISLDNCLKSQLNRIPGYHPPPRGPVTVFYIFH